MPVMSPMRRMVCRWTRSLSGGDVPVHHVEAAPAALFADDIGAAVEIRPLRIESDFHRLGGQPTGAERLR